MRYMILPGDLGLRALAVWAALTWWLGRRPAALAKEAWDAAAIHVAWTGAVARGAWARILAVAVPVIYGAAALQLAGQVPSRVDTSPLNHRQILEEGWNLKPEGAAQMEADLARRPEDLKTRVILMSYYYQKMMPEPRARLLLWLIENHPDSGVFLVAYDVASPSAFAGSTEADFLKAKALWLQQAERFPANGHVLANAAQALAPRDPELAFSLVKRARTAEPANSEWTVWLARVYARAVRLSIAGGRDKLRVFSSQGTTYPGRLGFALSFTQSESLKQELETSRDAALVGETGEALVFETRRLLDHPAAGPEPHSSAAFGEHLLERARSLDPANPRWHAE